jgi:hypothetical protein
VRCRRCNVSDNDNGEVEYRSISSLHSRKEQAILDQVSSPLPDWISYVWARNAVEIRCGDRNVETARRVDEDCLKVRNTAKHHWRK